MNYLNIIGGGKAARTVNESYQSRMDIHRWGPCGLMLHVLNTSQPICLHEQFSQAQYYTTKNEKASAIITFFLGCWFCFTCFTAYFSI